MYCMCQYNKFSDPVIQSNLCGKVRSAGSTSCVFFGLLPLIIELPNHVTIEYNHEYTNVILKIDHAPGVIRDHIMRGSHYNTIRL